MFRGKYSEGFDPDKHLERIGVVNQTTMLATETQAIADFFKTTLTSKYVENPSAHFADTRDTLCYATNDNQQATNAVLNHQADLAIVVGGYNSSNTSQIVTILSQKMPAYFISGANEITDRNEIHHFEYGNHTGITTSGWLPGKESVTIVLTSGASCPDTILESVLTKILSFFTEITSVEEAVQNAIA